uniref:Uncharacterized protein n=1 Tax=Chelonoidis abingdonii TaxID=106734 RepID=A0A8C0QQS3_CHEAB
EGASWNGSEELAPQACRGTQPDQLRLHLVPNQVRGLPPLAALQVVGGDGVGHLGGVQCPFQPHFLGRQQVGLGRQVLDLPLELGLPEVRVLEALAQLGGGVLLGALGQGGGVGGQALGLVAAALGAVAVGEGLVVLGVVVLVPLLGQVLGGAEAGRGQAARGVRPRVQRRLVHLHGQLGHRHRLRRRLPGPGPCSIYSVTSREVIHALTVGDKTAAALPAPLLLDVLSIKHGHLFVCFPEADASRRAFRDPLQMLRFMVDTVLNAW